jgi:hypothetical protein
MRSNQYEYHTICNLLGEDMLHFHFFRAKAKTKRTSQKCRERSLYDVCL